MTFQGITGRVRSRNGSLCMLVISALLARRMARGSGVGSSTDALASSTNPFPNTPPPPAADDDDDDDDDDDVALVAPVSTLAFDKDENGNADVTAGAIANGFASDEDDWLFAPAGNVRLASFNNHQ